MKTALIMLSTMLAGAGLGWFTGRGSRPVVPASSSVTKPIAADSSQPHLQPKVIYEHLDWSKLESDNLTQYAASLRAIGCPEQTVFDIIRAHVFALYQTKVNRIFDPLARYWNTPDQAKAMDEQVKAIRRERDKLLADLGFEDSAFDPSSPVPPEKQRHVAEALNRFPKVELGPDSTPEDRARDDANRKARINYLSQFLTPDEVIDYRIAQDGNPWSTRAALAGINPSDAEFRKVFDVLDGVNLNMTNNGFLAADLEAKLKQALGDERYAEYHRDIDSGNLDIRFWARTFQLTEDQTQQLIAARSSPESKNPQQFRQKISEIIQNPGQAESFLRKWSPKK